MAMQVQRLIKGSNAHEGHNILFLAQGIDAGMFDSDPERKDKVLIKIRAFISKNIPMTPVASYNAFIK